MAASDVPQKRYTLPCSGAWLGKALHQIIRESFPALGSRGSLQAISNGLVSDSVTGEPLQDGKAAVPEGHGLHVDLRHGVAGRGEAKRPRLHDRMKVHHDDEFLTVVSKNSGTLTQRLEGDAPSKRAKGQPLTELLKTYWRVQGMGSLEPHLIQRLDVETSGLLVVPKTGDVAAKLQRQLKPPRTLTREYLAIVEGSISRKKGTWSSVLGRAKDGLRRTVSQEVRQGPGQRGPRGQLATTNFSIEREYEGATLLRVKLETGRTHQIRIHCAESGHPVAGDTTYQGLAARTLELLEAKKISPRSVNSPYHEAMHLLKLLGAGERRHLPAPRLALHSTRITFKHPETGKRMSFEEPLPAELAELLARLKPRG